MRKFDKVHRNLLIFGFVWGLISLSALLFLSMGPRIDTISYLFFLPGTIALALSREISLPHLPYPIYFVLLLVPAIIGMIVVELIYAFCRVIKWAFQTK